MNFYAHATVACWERGDPEFVLGSMLPDFATMAGTRLRSAGHAGVAAGMVLHRVSDAAFHESPRFGALWLAGTRWLRENGVSRGAARGAAHVGIELLLDGVLVDDARVRERYAAALDAGADRALRATLRWDADDGDRRWQRLQSRLAAHGVPLEYRRPEVVAQRVTRALSARPRLALEADESGTLARWLDRAQPDVVAAAPELLDQVRSGIAARSPR